MKILFIGDVHGQLNVLERLVNESDADIAVQCGDMGVWIDCLPGKSLPKKYRLSLNKPVYFVEGNHDNHAYLASIKQGEGVGVEMFKNLIWMPRGAKKEIGGKKFLFCGGADSVDKAYRLAYYPGTWWPEEVIEPSVLDCVNKDDEFDFVVTHDRPEFVTHRLFPGTKIVGTSSMVLSNLYSKIIAKNWVNGHWHERCDADLFDTHFVTLNMLPMRGEHVDASSDCCWLTEV